MSYASNDPFLRTFFSRIPPEIAASFTGQQLVAIKMAFGGRTWGSHTIDIRFSFPLLWRRFYFVLLAGRERRSPGRRSIERDSHPMATLGNMIVSTAFFVVLLLPFLLSLYAVILAFNPGAGPDNPNSLAGVFLEQLRQLFR